MGNTIYLDVLVILNLYVTFFLLLGTSKLLHCRVSKWRMLFGSIAGGVFSLSILFELSPTVQVLLKLSMGALLVLITFFNINAGVRRFLRSLLVFTLVNFFYGGLMFALWFFAAPSGMAYKNGVAYFKITALQLTVATIIAYGGVALFCRWLDRRGSSKNYTEVHICLDGKEVLVKGIIDTGNKLLDIFTGLPVIVCTYKAVSDILPVTMREYFENPLELVSDDQASPAVKAGFRLLPVTVVGAELLLPAFKPSKVSIGANNSTAIVAVTSGSLGNGDFEAIIPEIPD